MFKHLRTVESSCLPTVLDQETYQTYFQKLCREERSDFFRPEVYAPLLSQVEARAHWIWESGHFDQVNWIGIGGTALGAQWAFPMVGREEKVVVLDNLDAWLFHKAMRWVRDWNRTHVIVVSKSGNTLETLRLTEEIYSYVEVNNGVGKNKAERWTIVTESETNVLGSWAKKQAIPILLTPKSVGGRFSWFTPMGGLAYLAAPHTNASLLPQVLHETQRRLKETPYPLLGHSLKALEEGCEAIYLMVYSSRYRDLGTWMMQLWNESLGKPQSPVPFLSCGVGSVDQHSDLQFLMESPRRLWTILVDVTSEPVEATAVQQTPNNTNLRGGVFQSPQTSCLSLELLRKKQAQATFQAMRQAGRHVTYVELSVQGGLEDWWELAYCWMSWVALLGYHVAINPYDQPGVEGGKRIMRQAGLGY